MQVERIGVSKWPFSPDVYLKGTSYPITASEADRMHRETLRSQAAQIVNSTLSKNESYQYWAIILAVFPVITVFGNVLVVLSVLRESNLHTATNYFIVSLAGADIGLAILVMPLSGWVEVRWNQQQFGHYLSPPNGDYFYLKLLSLKIIHNESGIRCFKIEENEVSWK